MSPPLGPTVPQVQPPSARPAYTRARTHPDFAKKLKHLQQSDPVDPKDLARRLDTFLAEQNAAPDGIVPRRLKKAPSSTPASRTTPAPATPPPDVPRPPSFHPESLPQHFDLQKFVHNAPSSLSTTSNGPDSEITNLAYPIPVAVLSTSSARQSLELPNDTSLFLSTSPRALPPPPRSSRIEPLPTELHHVQDESSSPTGNTAVRRRPESIPYVSRTAAQHLVQTTMHIGAERETIYVAPHLGSELPSPPLPLLTLEPLSPLKTSFFKENPVQNSFVTTPLQSALSPGARTSIGSTSTMANYTTAPTSPAPQQMNNMNSTSVLPSDITSRLEKRKSWHPRNLMASMKPRNESSDRRQTTIQTTAVMVEAARQGQAREIKIQPRPKSTAFENLTTTKSVLDLSSTSHLPSTPTLIDAHDDKEQKDGKEVQPKDNLWNRRARRKTVGAAESERAKDELSSMPSMEHLRCKQLAMREKALADSKKAKVERTASPKRPVQQVDLPNQDLPTAATSTYEPKKRITRPLKVVPPPTTAKPTVRQSDSSLLRHIPQKQSKPQERPKSPVEFRRISRGNDQPVLITRPEGEKYPKTATSRNNLSPGTTISPLALALGVSSLPRGIHLLEESPSSEHIARSTGVISADCDVGVLDSISYLTPSEEHKSETVERPKHQRDPSKPKLLLGPFPLSRPASPSSSPPKKPLPQPPRFSSLQRKAHNSQPASKDIPAEQLMPWDQPMPIDLPAPLEHTRSVSPSLEQQKPKHAREVSITKIVSVPRVVTSSASSPPPLEISSPREIAQWEILPPREAPAPKDSIRNNIFSQEQRSPIPPQPSEFRPQSQNNRKIFPSIDINQPHLDRKRSQPILNQYGEPALRPRTSSTDIRPPFSQDSSTPSRSRAGSNALRPKTSGGLRTTPVYTIEVRDDEIAEMTPASVKLLREQQSLLRRRALAAAGHSDPDRALRRSPTPLSELRDRRTAHSPATRAASLGRKRGRSPVLLAGPGLPRNTIPRVSLDRQGRIQTHLDGSADRRPTPPLLKGPLDIRAIPPKSASLRPSPDPAMDGAVDSSSPKAQSLGVRFNGHSGSASIITQGPPIVPHVSGTQMAEEMRLERERDINANRAKYGLPERSFSMPYVEEKSAARLEGHETPDKERRRRGKDKWWKIWRVL